MPKMKTKSSCKKRMTLTGTGKIKFKTAGKRHNMEAKTKKQIRQNRKASYAFAGDAAFICKNFIPYGLK